VSRIRVSCDLATNGGFLLTALVALASSRRCHALCPSGRIQMISQFAKLSLLVLLSIAVADAATTGNIRGTVTDASGAAISQALVTTTNEATNESYTLTTNSSGVYEFLLLPVGNYTLRVEHAGFKRYVLLHIRLDVNQVGSFDVTLRVGTVESKVEVEANPIQVDTVSTQLGTVIESKSIVDLPLNGRDIYQLVALQPGISVPGQGTYYGSPDVNNPIFDFHQEGGSMVFSSGGGRLVMNDFMVDGGDTNGTIANEALLHIMPDAVEEFRVLTNTFNPEFGRNSGSVVNIITRSGTNNWHGNAFEFLRNDALNAHNYFETTGKAPYKLNQFGGTFGGPIHKDTTFFFVGYQDTRERRGVPGTLTTVFSDADRSGNFLDRDPSGFSGVTTDALCFPRGSSNCFASGTAYSTIFPKATIPTSSFDPVAANILDKYIPPPNVGVNSLVITPNQPHNSDDFDIKLDHHFSPKHKIAGSYFFDDSFFGDFGLGNIPGFPVVSKERTQAVNISETWVVDPFTLNEFRVSYLRDARGAEDDPVVSGSPSSFGFTGIKTGPPASLQSIPVIDIFGGPIIGGPGQGSGGGANIENVYMVTDDFSHIIGRHTIKFGGGYSSVNHKQLEVYLFDGQFNYGAGGSNTTGDAFADFVLGLPDSYSQGSASYERLHSNQASLFAQDSWHVRHNVSLNYGLRWELFTPFTDKADAISAFRFPAPGQAPEQSQVFPTAPPGLVFPGDPGIPRGLTQTYYKSFAPRIGVSYSPDWLGANKLVIRSGFGLFYNPMEQAVLLQFNGDPPYGGSSFVAAPGFENPFTDQGGTTFPSPFPFQIPNRGAPVNFKNFFPIYMYGNFPPNVRTQYLDQYNVNTEYQLSPTIVLGAGYVGSQGHRLLATYDANAGNPQLCLQLAALGCGPFGEDTTYVLPSGQTLYGTRPAGVFSNNGVSGANGLEAFGNIFTIPSVASSSYNSGQFRLERRGERIQFLASYTWSQSRDNASGFENLLNPFCFKCDRELSGFDVRNRFVFSSTYGLPFDRFASSGGKKNLLSGWQVGGITTFQSGVPVRLTDLASDNSLTGGFDFEPVDRPSLIGKVRIMNPRNPSHLYFDPGAFTHEPLGQIGNIPHDLFAGPGVNNWDFSLLKRTTIKERFIWEFRAEFFNIFNHAQFLNPDGDIAGNFGKVTAARDPRFIQFATKIAF